MISFLFYVNKAHAPLYDWLDQNFDAVFDKAPDNSRLILPELTGISCDEDNLDRSLAFYKDRGELFKASLDWAEEDTRNCLTLKNRQQEALFSFFSTY